LKGAAVAKIHEIYLDDLVILVQEAQLRDYF